MRATISPRGVGLDLPHALERTGFALGRSATVTLAEDPQEAIQNHTPPLCL
jgi:hypothetical protein